MKVKPIEEIQNILQPIADEMEIEIVEVEFKQGKEAALTVYIDIEMPIHGKVYTSLDTDRSSIDQHQPQRPDPIPCRPVSESPRTGGIG